MPKIKYYPISKKHGITQFPPPECNIHYSKGYVQAHWEWCEDLVVGEIDVDSPEVILNDIPDEFKSFIRCKAYEDGHSSGNDEVVAIMKSLVHDLSPAIKTFAQRAKIVY